MADEVDMKTQVAQLQEQFRLAQELQSEEIAKARKAVEDFQQEVLKMKEKEVAQQKQVEALQAAMAASQAAGSKEEVGLRMIDTEANYQKVNATGELVKNMFAGLNPTSTNDLAATMHVMNVLCVSKQWAVPGRQLTSQEYWVQVALDPFMDPYSVCTVFSRPVNFEIKQLITKGTQGANLAAAMFSLRKCIQEAVYDEHKIPRDERVVGAFMPVGLWLTALTKAVRIYRWVAQQLLNASVQEADGLTKARFGTLAKALLQLAEQVSDLWDSIGLLQATAAKPYEVQEALANTWNEAGSIWRAAMAKLNPPMFIWTLGSNSTATQLRDLYKDWYREPAGFSNCDRRPPKLRDAPSGGDQDTKRGGNAGKSSVYWGHKDDQGRFSRPDASITQLKSFQWLKDLGSKGPKFIRVCEAFMKGKKCSSPDEECPDYHGCYHCKENADKSAAQCISHSPSNCKEKK